MQDPRAEVCTLKPRMKWNLNWDGKASCLALGLPEPVLSGLYYLGFQRGSRHFVSILLVLASRRHLVPNWSEDPPTLDPSSDCQSALSRH